MHMINSSIRRRCGTGSSPRFNDRGSTLLHRWNKVAGVPVHIDQRHGIGAANGCAMNVWVLRRRVVSPNAQTINIANMLAGFLRQLRHCAVVVESRHRSKIARIQIRRIALGYQTVGICRVTDH